MCMCYHLAVLAYICDAYQDEEASARKRIVRVIHYYQDYLKKKIFFSGAKVSCLPRSL